MIISKTPLRISFFGGGTDFYEYYSNSRYGYGSVLSTTVNMYVYITINKRFDNKIRIVYMGNELVDSIDEIKHDLIRNALKMTGISEGIEIIYSADIPISSAGVGLASSSALAVGLMNVLHAYKGEYVTPEKLAREACHIEIDCIGQKIGVQDQYAVAYGGFRRYRFFSNGEVTADPVLCSEKNKQLLKESLLLFYTGSGRDSRNILEEQTANMKRNMEDLDKLVEAVSRNEKNLFDGDISKWGEELNEAWQIKKSFANGISSNEIDCMYESARNAGALGGKILGAGGAGFMLLFAPKDKHDQIRKALSDYKEVDFKFERMGTRIIFSE